MDEMLFPDADIDECAEGLHNCSRQTQVMVTYHHIE